MWTTSNLPFSKVRLSSGFSKRRRMTSSWALSVIIACSSKPFHTKDTKASRWLVLQCLLNITNQISYVVASIEQIHHHVADFDPVRLGLGDNFVPPVPKLFQFVADGV